MEHLSFEENSIVRNGSELNQNDVLHQRMGFIEKKLNTIFEHIQLSNKKLVQDIHNLDSNVERRVKGMERKIDVLSEIVINQQNKCENGATERDIMTVKLSSINDSINKISKDVKQAYSTVIENTNFLVKRTVNNHNEVVEIPTKRASNTRNEIEKPTNKNHRYDKYETLFSDTSTSTLSDDSDGSSNSKNRHTLFSKQLSEICLGVELIKEKMNSWLRYSKKAIKNSDENTNVMLERFLGLEADLQNSAADDKIFHERISKKLGDISNNSVYGGSLSSNELFGLEGKISKIFKSQFVLLGNNIDRNQKLVSNRLMDLFTEITHKPTTAEMEISQKSVQKHIDELIANNYLRHSSTLFDEMGKQNEFHSKLLNSIKDLKLVASGLQNIRHDTSPSLEEIRCDISKIPDDIGSYLAALEENLCNNLATHIRGIHNITLQSILERFDTIEQRMGVIRKYVKYSRGHPSNQEQNTPTTNEKFATAEELQNLVTIQTKCVDMLKLIHPFQNINKTTSTTNKWQTVAKLILELLTCLRRFENIEKDIRYTIGLQILLGGNVAPRNKLFCYT